MAVVAERVDVGTSPTALNGSDGSDYRSGKSLLIRNRATVSIDVGGADVAATAGFELAAGESISIALEPGEVVYGIVAAATARVDVLRQGVVA